MAAYWTLEEARAYLPRLRQLLAALQRAADAARVSRGNGHVRARRPDPDAGSTPPAVAPPAGMSPREALAELQQRGIILRDPADGLVDFPALHPSGREVLLCWRAGEDDVAWWHLPEDGFAGRRPLPLPPEL
jgi:hypothetical protein